MYVGHQRGQSSSRCLSWAIYPELGQMWINKDFRNKGQFGTQSTVSHRLCLLMELCRLKHLYHADSLTVTLSIAVITLNRSTLKSSGYHSSRIFSNWNDDNISNHYFVIKICNCICLLKWFSEFEVYRYNIFLFIDWNWLVYSV